MPQHLEIVLHGQTIGCVTTGNRSGTVYSVFLTVAGHRLEAGNIDTGVQCQPQEPEARKKDFRNDFTHARRGIAGATRAAENLRKQLTELSLARAAPLPLTIRLYTKVWDRGVIKVWDRGVIKVLPIGKDSTRVQVQLLVGTGPHRRDSAIPSKPYPFETVETDVRCDVSHVERALEVFEKVGESLVETLSRHCTT